MVTWTLFFVYMVFSYIGFSIFAQMGGGTGTTVLTTITSALRPLSFVILVVSNIIWSITIFYGLKNTPYAVPMLYAGGVIISFIYATLFMGGEVTLLRICGVGVIVVGIYLLS